MLGRQMRITKCHAQRPVSQELLDALDIDARLSQSGRTCMPQHMRNHLTVIPHDGLVLCRNPAIAEPRVGDIPEWTSLASPRLALLVHNCFCAS